MVSDKDMIFKSMKPPRRNMFPKGKTPLGSAGYDNTREDIEKLKHLREGTIQHIPANPKDIVNREFVQKYRNETGSSGYYSGGSLSDGGGCTFDITAGQGHIRATASSVAPLNEITWGASTAVAVADNTTTYVFIDDTGALITNTDEFVESEDLIMIGMVTCESGGIVSVFNLGVRLDESIGQAGRYIRRVHSIIRDARKGGLMLGETGTRNITLSSGTLWWGRTEYTITSKNTSSGDSFDTYSSSGRGATGATQWPNEQYDNAGTLTTMTNNRWGTLWFYIEPNDNIVMLYGTEQFVSESQAEMASQPGVRGNRINNGSVLAARIIFQKGSATAEQIESAFEVVFSTTGISDHVNLSNIGTNTHAQIDTHITNTTPLIDNSIADALHRHSELVASDGSPDPAVSVDADGKVGFGTSTPDDLIHIKGSNARITFEDSDTDVKCRIGTRNDGALLLEADINGIGASEIVFLNDGSEKMRIDSSGQVGVGTAAPEAAMLELVAPASGFGALRMYRKTNVTGADVMNLHSDVGGTKNEKWRVEADGDTISDTGSYTSDERVKKNINPITNALEIIEQLKPVSHEYIEGWSKEGIRYSLIAQDVEKVLPSLVRNDGLDAPKFLKDQGVDKIKSLRYNDLIPILIKAVQELKAEIELLKK